MKLFHRNPPSEAGAVASPASNIDGVISKYKIVHRETSLDALESIGKGRTDWAETTSKKRKKKKTKKKTKKRKQYDAVVDQIPTAHSYDSVDSQEDVLEVRSKASRYSVEGDDEDKNMSSDEDVGDDRYSTHGDHSEVDPMWSASFDSNPPRWRSWSDDEREETNKKDGVFGGTRACGPETRDLILGLVDTTDDERDSPRRTKKHTKKEKKKKRTEVPVSPKNQLSSEPKSLKPRKEKMNKKKKDGKKKSKDIAKRPGTKDKSKGEKAVRTASERKTKPKNAEDVDSDLEKAPKKSQKPKRAKKSKHSVSPGKDQRDVPLTATSEVTDTTGSMPNKIEVKKLESRESKEAGEKKAEKVKYRESAKEDKKKAKKDKSRGSKEADEKKEKKVMVSKRVDEKKAKKDIGVKTVIRHVPPPLKDGKPISRAKKTKKGKDDATESLNDSFIAAESVPGRMLKHIGMFRPKLATAQGERPERSRGVEKISPVVEEALKSINSPTKEFSITENKSALADEALEELDVSNEQSEALSKKKPKRMSTVRDELAMSSFPMELDEYSTAPLVGDEPAIVQCLKFYSCGAVANAALTVMDWKPKQIETGRLFDDLHQEVDEVLAQRLLESSRCAPGTPGTPKPKFEVVLDEDGIPNEMEYNPNEEEDFLEEAPELDRVSTAASIVLDVSQMTLHLDDDTAVSLPSRIRRFGSHRSDEISITSCEIPTIVQTKSDIAAMKYSAREERRKSKYSSSQKQGMRSIKRYFSRRPWGSKKKLGPSYSYSYSYADVNEDAVRTKETAKSNKRAIRNMFGRLSKKSQT